MEGLKQFIDSIIKENPNIFSNNYYFDKYLNNKNIYQNVICINSNKFIEEIDILKYRKECLEKFNYDIIPIDIDIFGVHNCGNEFNQIENININILNKIIKYLKRHYKYQYVFYSNKTFGIIIKNYPIKKIHKKALNRFKKLLEKNDFGIDFIIMK